MPSFPILSWSTSSKSSLVTKSSSWNGVRDRRAHQKVSYCALTHSDHSTAGQQQRLPQLYFTAAHCSSLQRLHWIVMFNTFVLMYLIFYFWNSSSKYDVEGWGQNEAWVSSCQWKPTFAEKWQKIQHQQAKDQRSHHDTASPLNIYDWHINQRLWGQDSSI